MYIYFQNCYFLCGYLSICLSLGESSLFKVDECAYQQFLEKPILEDFKLL